jgi:signal transduction histidine kinase
MIDSDFLGAHILIVDDQVANIEILAGYLEMQGYQNIRSTVDSRKVLELFAEFNPDLILLDLAMPYLTGFEVMEQLKKVMPKNTYLPVLVLTADINSDSKKQALSGGASDFLTKPFDLNEVGLRIKNLLFARFLHTQMLDQNQVLEMKVRERTGELERINRELTEAKIKAEESDKLKTAFLNNISHEIRTPFNGILGFLSLLEEDDLEPDERRDYTQIINQSADRLLKTINDIVEIATIQAGQADLTLDQSRVRVILENIQRIYEPAARCKGLEFRLEWDLEQNFEKIYTDEAKLTSVLSSLIDNAIKFTSQGSVGIRVVQRDGQIEFAISDTGQGIAPDKHQIIFERFLQGDFSNTRQFEGTGLGLSIAKAYTEILGGQIRLESEPYVGSVFFVTFPVARTVSLASSRAEPQPAATESGKTEILVAEDDQVNFDYVKMVLKRAGFAVVRAVTGSAAIAICRDNPRINLVLMDVRMPEMDGYRATREIRIFRPELPVIALTAYALPGENISAREAGCSDYLAKPVNREVLLAVIRKHLAGPTKL